MGDEGRAQHRTSVEIFGEEYMIKGERHPEQVRRLAARVDACMRELAQRAPAVGSRRLAVLAALNLAAELATLEGKYARLLAMLQEEWQRGVAAVPPGQDASTDGSRPAPPRQVPLPMAPGAAAEQRSAGRPPEESGR